MTNFDMIFEKNKESFKNFVFNVIGTRYGIDKTTGDIVTCKELEKNNCEECKFKGAACCEEEMFAWLNKTCEGKKWIIRMGK